MTALILSACIISSSVDPFWGSGGTDVPVSEGVARGWNWEKAQSGNTHPGAVLPFGWVSACAYSGAYPTGYGRMGCAWTGPAPEIYSRNYAYGISHFHHSGTGWISKFYNYFLFSPFVVGSNPGKASRLDEEVAKPGYYAARLTDYGASFEVVPCRFAACHRYRFDSTNAYLLVDATNIGLRREYVRPANYSYLGERIDSVTVRTHSPFGWEGTLRAHGRDLHFAVILKGDFTDPFAEGGVFGCAVAGDQAESFVGFSLVSVAEARARSESAMNDGFDATRERAEKEWERALSRVRVRFGDKRLERRFYSALYHSLVKPTDCGVGYTDFSTFWDIYRTEIPLVMSLLPAVGRGIVEHLMNMTVRNGFSPICQIMDDSVVHKDMQATALPLFTLADAFFRGVIGVQDYRRIKRVFEKELGHADVSGMSPTHVLDLAGARHAVSLVAKACGDLDYAATMKNAASIGLSAYDRETGLLPLAAKYYEGNHWNYSFRPHPGMLDRVAMAGGETGFQRLLDRFFCFDESLCQWDPNKDRIRRPGRFEGLNNESDMDAPYAYLWSGRVDRLVEVIDLVRRFRFSDGRGGCPGNNDSGATGSWYAWNCLGIYPLTGTPYYLLGSPSVESAEIDFSSGSLRIVVERESPRSIYPLGYVVNGRETREPWVKVSEVEKGGTLVFRLGDSPVAKSPVPTWL